MAILQLSHDPILNSNAQVLILPVNSAGTLLGPVLTRTKTLYPDNYQRYHRACRDGRLMVGSCLIHKRQRESSGLGASGNGNQPSYIANLVISDHLYHPTRMPWLNDALSDLQQQLIPLIRYQGVRKIALLTRPLVFISSQQDDLQTTTDTDSAAFLSINSLSANSPTFKPLDWYDDTLPLLTQQLQDLPKVRIDLHLPKFLTI